MRYELIKWLCKKKKKGREFILGEKKSSSDIVKRIYI